MEPDSTAPKPTPDSAASAAEGLAPRRGIDRRTLLRASAGATPILLTLYSGSVSATGTTACTVASSFVSVATFASRNPGGANIINCTTKSAESWRVDANNTCGPDSATWPDWAKNLVSNYLGSTSSSYNGQLVGQVMKCSSLAGAGELAILQHILGLALTVQYAPSLINVASPSGGTLNKSYLGGIWQEYKRTGKYVVPVDNINWTETDLLTWLKMLQYPIPYK